MTMHEITHKHLSDITFACIGDASGNMAVSLIVAAEIGMVARRGSARAKALNDVYASLLFAHIMKPYDTFGNAAKTKALKHISVAVARRDPDRLCRNRPG